MFFSIKESHSSRLESRGREKAAKAAMNQEFITAQAALKAGQSAVAAAAAAAAERQRTAIATTGARTPTPRRRGFGL